MRKRTLAREHALKILYQLDITKRPLELILVEALKELPMEAREVALDRYEAAVNGAFKGDL